MPARSRWFNSTFPNSWDEYLKMKRASPFPIAVIGVLGASIWTTKVRKMSSGLTRGTSEVEQSRCAMNAFQTTTCASSAVENIPFVDPKRGVRVDSDEQER